MKGWHQRKHKRTSKTGKSFKAGRDKFPNESNYSLAQEIEKWSKLIADYEPYNPNQKGYFVGMRKMVADMRKEQSRRKKVEAKLEEKSKRVYTASKTDMTNPDYIKIKDLQRQYSQAALIADSRRLQYLWGKMRPEYRRIGLLHNTVESADELDLLHDDMLYASRNKEYSSISRILERITGEFIA